jgi:hypothetical protein
MTRTYNGWRNYETWVAALWLDNDAREFWPYWENAARKALRDAGETTTTARMEAACAALADRLRTEVEEAAPALDGMYADLLSAALSEIDWHEIAQDHLEEIDWDDLNLDDLP